MSEKWAISLEKLPQVSQPGERVAETSHTLENQTGSQLACRVIGGATDSIMALVASWSLPRGRRVSSLGSTLVTRCTRPEPRAGSPRAGLLPSPPGRERVYLPGGARLSGGGMSFHYFPRSTMPVRPGGARAAPVDALVYPSSGPASGFRSSLLRRATITSVLRSIPTSAMRLLARRSVCRALERGLAGTIRCKSGESRIYNWWGAKSQPWLQFAQTRSKKPSTGQNPRGLLMVLSSWEPPQSFTSTI